MKAIVIYATRHHNTKKVAEAIAEGLRTKGTVEMFDVENAPATFAKDLDLVVVGGPTEGHGLTPPMEAFLGRLDREALFGIHVATFDTRLRWPQWVSGAAGIGIGKELVAACGIAVAPPESFFVRGNPPSLHTGELERAETWGVYVANKAVAREKVTA